MLTIWETKKLTDVAGQPSEIVRITSFPMYSIEIAVGQNLSDWSCNVGDPNSTLRLALADNSFMQNVY